MNAALFAVLVAWLQPLLDTPATPPPTHVRAGVSAPFEGVLYPAERLDRLLNDRDACIIERDAARRAVVRLEAVPRQLQALLTQGLLGFSARLDRFTADTTARLAAAPLPPVPDPPWYSTTWIKLGAGAIVGALGMWVVECVRENCRR